MNRAYGLQSVAQAEALIGELEQRFGLRSAGRSSVRTVHLDTFDWRLFRSGSRLFLESAGTAAPESRLCWTTSDEGARIARVARPPDSADDLPRAWQTALRRVLHPRRLLEQVRVDLQRRTLILLDGAEKTLARIHLEHGRVLPAAGLAGGPAGPWLRVVPVRGYANETGPLVQFLERQRGLAAHPAAELGLALAPAGRSAGDDPSRFAPELEPTQRADVALRILLEQLRRILLANEDGLRRDLDTEFLHDFRVAVRRMRSALGQLADVLPAHRAQPAREGLAWLGRACGATRDLDVYLERFDGYRRGLPDSARGALDALQRFLERERQASRREMLAELDSPRYAALLATLGLLATADGEEPTSQASRRVAELSRERLQRAWRRVLEQGVRIHDDPSAGQLHRLRIRCKKLRYQLEFFRSLYDGDDWSACVRSLKRMQDNLGNFNDFEVQQRQLTAFAQQMARDGQGEVETILVLGRLIEQLARRQRVERRRFRECFEDFAAEEGQARFRDLLEGPRRA